MIKTELHAHTDGDQADRIAHSAETLIDRASALGYGALAITLHDRWTDPAPLRDYAAGRGLVILSGIERSIERKHVLIINGPKDAERLRTFADLRAYRAANPSALVVAPHAFYPIPSALGGMLDRHPDLFDALEVNAMRVKGVDFNRRAMAWAPRTASRWSATRTCTSSRSSGQRTRWWTRQNRRPTPSATRSNADASRSSRPT